MAAVTPWGTGSSHAEAVREEVLVSREPARENGPMPEHQGVGIDTYDGSAALLTEELQTLYAAAYAGPPYYDGPDDVAEFVSEWPALMKRPGFRLALARLPDDRLVGFALGHIVDPGSGIWSVPATQSTDGGAQNSFGIAEFGVHPDWWRRGIARCLHDALLAGRTEPQVVLWVHADAPAARAAYRRWGYRFVGPASRPPYQVMCLERN